MYVPVAVWGCVTIEPAWPICFWAPLHRVKGPAALKGEVVGR